MPEHDPFCLGELSCSCEMIALIREDTREGVAQMLEEGEFHPSPDADGQVTDQSRWFNEGIRYAVMMIRYNDPSNE